MLHIGIIPGSNLASRNNFEFLEQIIQKNFGQNAEKKKHHH